MSGNDKVDTDKKFGINVISSSCGVRSATLRMWEKRYSVFTPERTPTGRRFYTEEDLGRAVLISKLIDHGHTISQLAPFDAEHLKGMLEVLELNSNNRLTTSKTSNASTEDLLVFLSDFDVDSLVNELNHQRLTNGTKDFLFNIILPIIREAGRGVIKRELTITQEHILSSLIRDQLAQIYLPVIGKNKSVEIGITTPEGNAHELGIMIADLLCRSDRKPTRYFGAGNPARPLGEAINALKISKLVLGALSSEKWNYFEMIIPYLQELDDKLNHQIDVILGGGSPLDFPDFKNIRKITIAPTFEELDAIVG